MSLMLVLVKKWQKGADPQVHLRADKEGKYDTVAQVLATASGAGLTKIAFVNE